MVWIDGWMNEMILFPGKDIGELDLSSNNLRSIPPDIRKLVNLVVLDMSRNGLRCTHSHDFTGLPAELGQLPSLHVILLAECNLQFVPPAVWKCQNLKVSTKIDFDIICRNQRVFSMGTDFIRHNLTSIDVRL